VGGLEEQHVPPILDVRNYLNNPRAEVLAVLVVGVVLVIAPCALFDVEVKS
jgi:hypothetical protein